MGSLHVFDVSPVLHAANNVAPLASDFTRDCPVGGMKLLLRKISYLLVNGESVVCVFDSKTERSIKFPNYKKGRKKVPEVILQAEALYKFLSNAGVCCLKINGLEADDIIYNVVNQSLKDYLNIYIYSCDYDLCHNIYENRVSFRAVTQQTLNVSFSNFSEVLSSVFADSKFRIPYNMVTAYKVFCGDKSDGIGSFTASDGTPGYVLFNKLVDFAFSLDKPLPFHVLRSKELILKLAPLLGLSESDIEIIKERCYLFFPFDKQLDFFPTNNRNVNLDYYKKLVRTIGDKDSCRLLNCWDVSSKQIEQELFEYGKAYKSGEFHVDNNLSLDELEIKNSSVFIRGL